MVTAREFRNRFEPKTKGGFQWKYLGDGCGQVLVEDAWRLVRWDADGNCVGNEYGADRALCSLVISLNKTTVWINPQHLSLASGMWYAEAKEGYIAVEVLHE